MIEIDTLPHEPEKAIQVLIQRMLTITPHGNGTITDLGRAQPRMLTSLKLHAITAIRIAGRIDDPEIRGVLEETLRIEENRSYKSTRQGFEDAFAVIALANLDQHFLSQECIQEFDRAKLDPDEKQQIRELMAQARDSTFRANFLTERNKRRINHHISKIEAELYKEVSGFATFLAAATDVSGLLKQFGKDGKEIAEAIQIARTVTERKVEGYQQIEAQEKPKRLPKPDEETVD